MFYVRQPNSIKHNIQKPSYLNNEVKHVVNNKNTKIQITKIPPRYLKHQPKPIKTSIFEEEKIPDQSNTTTEFDPFADCNSEKGSAENLLVSPGYSELKSSIDKAKINELRLFFSSAVKTRGKRKEIYYLESRTIGLECPEHNFPYLDFSIDPAFLSQPHSGSPKPSEISMGHPLNQIPMNDNSLFGNDSDESISGLGPEELEDFPINARKTAISPKNENIPFLSCTLNNEEILCEMNGKLGMIFCFRIKGNSEINKEIEFLISVTEETKNDIKKIKVKENDIILIISYEFLKEEEIRKGIIKIMEQNCEKTLQPRKIAKSILQYIQDQRQKDLDITIIVSLISQSI